MRVKKWVRILLMYLFTIFITLLLFFPIDISVYGYAITTNLEKYFLLNISILTILFCIYSIAVPFLNRKFRGRKTFQRILIEIIYVIILINLIEFSYQNLLVGYVNPIDFFAYTFKYNFLFISVLEGIFNIFLFEVLFLFYQHIEETIKKEKLKYNQLKNQLNPHFLFNSLNILLAMIYKRKPNECADFIEKLSDVYRYILNNEDKSLILVKEEVNFISKYGEILKTRFNNGFILNINLKEEDLKKKILLMSLQLLVENAVKHNIACKEIPLIIDIFSDNSSIIVSNTKNIRSNKTTSTGIGLNNLNQRYRIITNKDIKIIDEDNYFKVIIPLI
jgi:two-component system, LytTR family, sensor kinase